MDRAHPLHRVLADPFHRRLGREAGLHRRVEPPSPTLVGREHLKCGEHIGRFGQIGIDAGRDAFQIRAEVFKREIKPRSLGFRIVGNDAADEGAGPQNRRMADCEAAMELYAQSTKGG